MDTKIEKDSELTWREGEGRGRWVEHQLRRETKQQVKRGALLYWAVLFMLSTVAIHGATIVKQLPPSVVLAVLLVGFTLIQAVVAIGVAVIPGQRLLLMAAVVEVVGVLVWLVAHTVGLLDGFAVWRVETLWTPDLYLPILEGLSAGFFLSLWARTWGEARGVRHILGKWLPWLLVLLLLVGIALKSIVLVAFFLVPGVLPSSLQYIFLPLVGVLAVFLLLRLVNRSVRARTPGAWRTAFILLPALLVVAMVTWGGCVSASYTAWLSASTAMSVPAGQTRTLTYCDSNTGAPLAMDISEPAAQANRPAPAVFYIHGGETLVGYRVLDDGTPVGTALAQLRTDLLNRGFVVGSIDYGMVPFYSPGEQVREAKCAVRFLRAHASELGIDPQRIGVYGESQGGYISAMLGTVAHDPTYDAGQYLNQSSQVQAVVDMWGPMDLSNFSGSPWWAALLVGHATTEQLHHASPLYHVAAGDPPFLIMHGSDDWFIAPHHSQDMVKRLQAAGVPVTFVMIQHDSHGLISPTAGYTEQPSPDALIGMIADFFSRTLAR